MKKLLIIIAVCTVFPSISHQSTYAQKQSRIEKLYEHIAKAEREKYDKARVKIDPKSAETYKNELTLGDAFYKLFYTPGFDAIEPYLKTMKEVNQKDGGNSARAICTEAGIKLENFTQKSDSAIYKILSDSREQLKESRAILDMLTQYNYKILPEILTNIIVIKEKVQFEDLNAQPSKEKCETYIADFTKQHRYNAVAKIYNDLLYKEVCNQKDEPSILAYFDNPILKTFYTDTKEERAYMSEVVKTYDNYLFEQIQKANTPEALKEKIKAYQQTTYLTTKIHTPAVEYKNDSIDYVILVRQLDSSSKLPLVKEYLQGHKYREFLDKAHRLREQFVVSSIWSDPTTMKFYSGNKVSKVSKILNDSVIMTHFNYNEHGFLLNIIKNIEVQGTPPTVICTNFKYNELGKCYESETTDTITKTVLHQATYQYNAKGDISIKNDKWNDNRSRVETYNSNGKIEQIQEFANGQINAQTNFMYGNNGMLVQKIWVNMKPNIDNPVTKQTTDYTYNEYGFLVNSSYVKETLQNEKISGNIKFLYDEFANEIDSNYKYEYDQTGAWISRTNKTNQADMEKIEYTYK